MFIEPPIDLHHFGKGPVVHILFESLDKFKRRVLTSCVSLSSSLLGDLVDDDIRHWLNDKLISRDDRVRS